MAQGHESSAGIERKLGSDEDAERITKLIWALDEFRSLNRNITANQIVIFLHIAAKEGITQKELERATGLDKDYRSRAQSLSTKGRRFFEKLRAILKDLR